MLSRSEKKIAHEDLPSSNQIKNFRRNLKRNEEDLKTVADFKNFLADFDPYAKTEETVLIHIGPNLDTQNFCFVFINRALLRNIRSLWSKPKSFPTNLY